MDTTATLIAYVVGSLVGIVLMAYIFSLILGTGKIIRQNKSIMKLLGEIAVKQGVETAKVVKILNESN